MKRIEIQLDDESMQEIVISANDAIRNVLASLMEDKGESGVITVKISLGKYTFRDGYRNIRDGLNIDYKVDTQITNKTSFSDKIITDNMMLQESGYAGYILTTAPDPQQSFYEYMEEEENNDKG